MTLIALGLCMLTTLAIFAQWRDGLVLWEALLLFPMGGTLGVFYSTQFIGMSATISQSRLSAAIGTYYVYQQLGFIAGPAVGLALVQGLFNGSLERNLLDSPRKEMVSFVHFEALVNYSSKLMVCRPLDRFLTILASRGNCLNRCKRS